MDYFFLSENTTVDRWIEVARGQCIRSVHFGSNRVKTKLTNKYFNFYISRYLQTFFKVFAKIFMLKIHLIGNNIRIIITIILFSSFLTVSEILRHI